MDQPNTPLKEGLNTQAPEQAPESLEKPRKIKPVYVVIVIVILLLICGGVTGGIYLFLRQAQDKGEETEDQEEEEDEEQETEEKESDPYEGWETCVYDDGIVEISFKIPQDWECIHSEGETGLVSTTLRSENIEFYIGFLFQAGCQDESGQCDKETLYESDEVKLYRIFNVNPDGSKYVIPYGYFYVDGEVIGTAGINFVSPDLQDRTLTEAEKSELKPVLDSIEISQSTVSIYFANPASYEDFTTFAEVERFTTQTDLYSFALDQLIAGPTDVEEASGYIATFELSGSSTCDGEDYTLEKDGNTITVEFCKDIVATFNPGGEGAWAGITLSAEGRAYEAIAKSLKFDDVEKVVVKDKYGACFAVSAGTNKDCVE
ncbi:GerMN domain-containing protein [Candidatus Dojkabacteria bacterium]|nr:GerMN domain-containing protein [Candidatus Dojkabacteria bacterium]